MAIWNVLYDSDFTVDIGAFYVNANDTAVRAAANGYLNGPSGLTANLPAALLSDATWLQLQDCSVTPCRDVQDFVGPGAAPMSVPEPTTALLVLVGIGAAAARRRPSRNQESGIRNQESGIRNQGAGLIRNQGGPCILIW